MSSIRSGDRRTIWYCPEVGFLVPACISGRHSMGMRMQTCMCLWCSQHTSTEVLSVNTRNTNQQPQQRHRTASHRTHRFSESPSVFLHGVGKVMWTCGGNVACRVCVPRGLIPWSRGWAVLAFRNPCGSMRSREDSGLSGVTLTPMDRGARRRCRRRLVVFTRRC